MKTVIKFEHVSRWYGNVLGLNDASVNIGKGIAGLVGPNGAGKTTFMRLAVGNILQNQGIVLINGESPWNNSELYRDVGFAPEGDNFFPWMTGFDYMVYSAKMFGYVGNDAKKRSMELLELMKLEHAASKKLTAYSKGMKQRIKVAQALIPDPKTLILDEPLNGLDPIMRMEMIDLFKEMSAKGKNILISSHILHEVEKMTDNIVLINRGRIIAEGNIHDIRNMIDSHPHHITIIADKPALLREKLVSTNYIQSVGGTDTVEVYTSYPATFYGDIPKIADKNKIVIRKLTSDDDNLEAVFNYLTQGAFQ